MARVTQAEVAEILDEELDSADDMTPFITAGNLIVTDRLGSSSTSTAMLKEIERWLVAHLWSIKKPLAKSESVSGIAVTYFGSSGKGLESTPYGQQVVLLDSTGLMAKKAKGTGIMDTITYTQEDAS